RRMVSREVARVDPERTLRRGGIHEVQPHVPGHEVRPAVAIEIGGCQTPPPAPRGSDADRSRDIPQARAIVVKELEGHPFARRDEIEPSVAIQVDPYRRRYQVDRL